MAPCTVARNVKVPGTQEAHTASHAKPRHRNVYRDEKLGDYGSIVNLAELLGPSGLIHKGPSSQLQCSRGLQALGRCGYDTLPYPVEIINLDEEMAQVVPNILY